MPRRARKKRVYLGEYRAPAATPPTPIARLVDEGELIAASAARIALGNKLILRILRDGHDFSADWLSEAVRKELRSLSREKSADAKRISKIIETARVLPGEAETNDDYRSNDVDNLERRRAMLLGLVERLDERADDDAYVDDLAGAVRDRAWDEVSTAIMARAVALVGSTEVLADADRDLRKDQVRADLRKLAKSVR